METVYLETTIISYLVSRPSRDLLVAAHQQVTRDWWTLYNHNFSCHISQIVLDEIMAGDPSQSHLRMEIAGKLPLVEITAESEYLTMAIMASKIMPAKAVQDAAHIAIATVAKMDYLLTWNCAHIANAQIMRHVAAICNTHGYGMPLICTPEELTGGAYHE